MIIMHNIWQNDNLNDVDIKCIIPNYKDLLVDASPTSGPAERITEEEVRAAIAKTKVDKAAGPMGLVSKMLTASGETGISWLTDFDLFNAIVKAGRIPADWKKS